MYAWFSSELYADAISTSTCEIGSQSLVDLLLSTVHFYERFRARGFQITARLFN
jgi:hypothetical protein